MHKRPLESVVHDVDFNRLVFLVQQPGIGKVAFALWLIIAGDDYELCHCRVSVSVELTDSTFPRSSERTVGRFLRSPSSVTPCLRLFARNWWRIARKSRRKRRIPTDATLNLEA